MGCGVCISQCPNESLSLVVDPDKGVIFDVDSMIELTRKAISNPGYDNVEYENETRKNLYNIFACVALVYASVICSYVVIVDNREISVKKGSPLEWQQLTALS